MHYFKLVMKIKLRMHSIKCKALQKCMIFHVFTCYCLKYMLGLECSKMRDFSKMGTFPSLTHSWQIYHPKDQNPFLVIDPGEITWNSNKNSCFAAILPLGLRWKIREDYLNVLHQETGSVNYDTSTGQTVLLHLLRDTWEFLGDRGNTHSMI